MSVLGTLETLKLRLCLGFTKARETLGWKPEITLDEMIQEMVNKDIEFAKRDELLTSGGFSRYAYE